MDYKQSAVLRFRDDLYATETTGIHIIDVASHYAKCRLPVEQKHMNAAGYVMGGAIFTLADFTFAIAANTDDEGVTVSITSNISYISATRGPVLYAEAQCVENKKKICFYTVDVTDDKGNLVAEVSITGYRPA